MKENLSVDLGIPLSRISIKATTNEGLGALGRTEGIAALGVWEPILEFDSTDHAK